MRTRLERIALAQRLLSARGWSCAALLTAVLSPSAAAFEGYEHKHLGDLAFRIAVDYAEVAKLRDSSKDSYWALPFEERCMKLDPAVRSFYRSRSGSVCPGVEPSAPTYGDIVKLVDYMSYPHELLEISSYRTLTAVPRGFEDLNQRLLVERRKDMTIGLARAATNNQYHFQAGLLSLLVRLHGEAIDQAYHGETFAALVANASADHFLHDFFAPGHITTTRENSHDAVALGMHDTVNRLGARFAVNRAKWDDDLAPLLAFMRENHPGGRGDYDLSIDGNPGGREETAGAIESLAKDHESLHVVGDDLLQTNPRQQLFMLLVEVRSLLDVLQTDPGRFSRNSLDAYRWTEYDDRKRNEPPKAGITYGDYDIDVKLLSRASNILILAVGGEAPVSEFSSSRLFLNAEIVPLALIGESEFLREHTINRPTQQCDIVSVCNMGPAFGVTWIRDDRFSALGPSLRIIKAFPKLDTQVSVYYQYLKYQFEAPEWKSSYGVRLDTGFSLYSAFVALGKGHFVDGAQQLQQDLVFSFGVAVGLPFSRIRVP